MTSLSSRVGSLLLSLSLGAALVAQAPSPKEFLGHDIGEDYFLADYSQLTSYWKALEQASDRLVLKEIGTTSYGQPMLMAVISAPENLARLEEIRSINERLARGRDASEQVAQELAAQGKAVVWIDGGLHATESVAGQNIIELVWRMVGGDSAEVQRILDNVVLLAVPANPDGLELVAKAYMATQSTRTPVLYQRYIGHDNNRDFYTANQLEARALNKVLYNEWYPQILYNHHQTAPRGTIIFTPPFRDPFNYNMDPLVVRGIELVSAHINHRFTAESKPGVISRSGASYSTWWNGGLRTTAYFHNMIGILTEVFGSPTPTRITQNLSRRVPYHDYPDPIATQEWHARQTIEYLQTSDMAILDLASRYPQELPMNMWRMARNSIERGSRDHWTPTPALLAKAREQERAGQSDPSGTGAFEDPALRDPRAYVLPPDQSDPASAIQFLRALRRNGVEIERATAAFEADGVSHPAGSFVVRAAQAFRPHVLDMFEPQHHPDDIGASGEPVRPYDSAGWTLAMQMGVDFARSLEGISGGSFEAVEEIEMAYPAGAVTAGSAGWLVSHGDINSFTVANRLTAAGQPAYWLEDSAGDMPAGTLFVPASVGSENVAAMARELGVSFRGVDQKPAGAAWRLGSPRVGIYMPYGGNMPSGWTQWVLEQFDFPVRLVWGAELASGEFQSELDALIFHTGLPAASADRNARAFARGRRGRGRGRAQPIDLDKLASALPPFEDWSDLAERQTPVPEDIVERLQSFMEKGGTVLAIGSQANGLIEKLELPTQVGPRRMEDGEDRRVPSSEFFVPGSLIWTDVDTSQPISWGVPSRLPVMFRRNPVFTQPTGNGLRSLVDYVDQDQLASGWAIGQEMLAGQSAVLEADRGAGSLFLIGPDITYRGQPNSSFKLVFNALFLGVASRVEKVD